MYENSMRPPRTLNDCVTPTGTVRLLIKTVNVLRILKFVSAITLVVGSLGGAITIAIEFESFWIFLGVLFGGLIVSALFFVLGWLMEIIFRGFTAKVHSSNVASKLKYYELASKENPNTEKNLSALDEYKKINQKKSEPVNVEPLQQPGLGKVCSCGHKLRTGAIVCPSCGRNV